VPTSVAVGPDGALYVGQLTGFPFPVGGASVWRVPTQGGAPEVHESGFTNIIDVAFGHDGSLYVLEFAKNGLLAGPPAGRLTRIAPGGVRSVIAENGLIAPGGVAIGPDGGIYLTNFGTSAGGGQVVRVVP
jgi:sugar lactone lactonase YvrE